MKVLGGDESDALGQQADLDGGGALALVALAELAEEVAAEAVDEALGGEHEGVGVAAARVPGDHAEEPGHQSRPALELGVAVAELAVHAPAPGEEPAVGRQGRRVVRACRQSRTACYTRVFLYIGNQGCKSEVRSSVAFSAESVIEFEISSWNIFKILSEYLLIEL